MKSDHNTERLATWFVVGFFVLVNIGCLLRAASTFAPTEDGETTTPTPSPSRIFPVPTGFVSDFAGVVDADSKRELEKELRRFRDTTKVDFAVVTVDSTGDKSIDDYSLAMAKEWKIGSEDGGLLLAVAIRDRTWRIQIDRKLEKVITNDEILQIGELIVPDFKRKDYSAGLRKCVKAMITALTPRLNNKQSNSNI